MRSKISTSQWASLWYGMLVLTKHQVYGFLLIPSFKVFQFPLTCDICTDPRSWNHAITNPVTHSRQSDNTAFALARSSMSARYPPVLLLTILRCRMKSVHGLSADRTSLWIGIFLITDPSSSIESWSPNREIEHQVGVDWMKSKLGCVVFCAACLLERFDYTHSSVAAGSFREFFVLEGIESSGQNIVSWRLHFLFPSKQSLYRDFIVVSDNF